MKILSKLKKVIIGIGAFVIALPVKIYGVYGELNDQIELLYGPPSQDLYGPPSIEPSKWGVILNIIRIISIPILLIIGLVAIIKSKKMSKTSKIIISIIAILIAIILFLIF